VLGIAGAVYAEDLLRLMGAREDVVQAGTGYAVHLFGGSITVILLITVNAALRGAGASALTLRILGVAHLINLILDPLLIFGWGPFPALGVTGAAVATNIGRSVAIVYQLRLLTAPGGRLRLERSHFALDRALMGRLLRLSSVAFVQSLLMVMAVPAQMRILTPFPAAAVAGYTIAWRITLFVIKPIWGLANAAGILVGQNLGAGRVERAERSVWIVARYNLLALGAVATLFMIAAPLIVGFFGPTSEGLVHGVECLRWYAVAYVFMAYGLVLRSAFNGAGDTATPTWISLLSDWGVKVFLSWLLAWPLGLGPRGVFIAIVIAEAVSAGTSMWIFRQGRWKNREV
jgi:putative MATE family efflux protein